MMRLNEPKTEARTYRYEFAPELSYLAGEVPFFEAECVPAGHLNPKYMAALDEIRRWQKAEMFSAARAEETDYAARREGIDRKAGEKVLMAIHDHCLRGWNTNIQDDGKPMVCDREHFLAFAECGVPGVADAFAGLRAFIEDWSKFLREDDEETAGN